MTHPHPLTSSQRELLGDVAELYALPDLRPTALDRTLRFGLIADPQYADVAPDIANNLYYRHALHKLPQAISALNQQPLDFVVTLGDLVDRHWESYATVLPLYDRLEHPHAVVLGNHDVQTIAQHLNNRAALPKSYYAFRLAGWRFIVYDGNDVSHYCNALNGDDYYQAETLLADLRAQQQPQAQPWNGAVGQQQLAWIEQQLIEARQQGENVGVFGHYPLAPPTTHILMNAHVLVDLLTSYNIRFCFSGHDHRGNFARIGQAGFYTMKGMLDGPADAPFAVVEVTEDSVKVNGFGGEVSRT
ncbi:metallophosphoesterase [Pantoea rwandensis]|uniref:metallophosphoesterase n=1 Tax=Pantoea rwandensis TaxID=1076550 RepID=UPI000A0FB1DC|nr:metallophosphoesterase [Pantoea rwandensis]